MTIFSADLSQFFPTVLGLQLVTFLTTNNQNIAKLLLFDFWIRLLANSGNTKK